MNQALDYLKESLQGQFVNRHELCTSKGRNRRELWTPLVGASGEHHPAEELGRGTVVGGVDVVSDGHDADVLLRELRLDLHTLVEVPAEPVQPGYVDSIVGTRPGWRVVQ